MNFTRKLSPRAIKLAIVQAVGEMRALSQDVRISDIAHYLCCTKETAKKHLDKAEFFGAIEHAVHSYRKPTIKNPKGSTYYTYHLTDYGRKLFNSEQAKDAKKTISMYKEMM